MSGDSVSLPTNVIHSDTVSRIQQGQVTDAQAQEKQAKKLQENPDDQRVVANSVSEADRARLKRKRRDQESRERREKQRKTGQPDAQGRGSMVDLKV